jgi:hypothetical protein
LLSLSGGKRAAKIESAMSESNKQELLPRAKFARREAFCFALATAMLFTALSKWICGLPFHRPFKLN